jgi:hyperosmotically inducible protein
MTIRNIRVLLIVLLTAALSACGSAEKEPEPTTTALPSAADNTAINERDSTGATTTPADQGNSEADLAMLAKIRQAVVDDKALSTNAHNVKIVTNNGVVTLRGPVKSAEEKKTIEAKATQVAGVTKVENLLEIEGTP